MLYGILFSVALGSCGLQTSASTYEYYEKEAYPRNIILMIGDGMGLSQVSYVSAQNKRGLRLELMPIIGFHKTYAYDNLITDSAAGATAIACGQKTFVRGIGMTPDSLPCETILERAKRKGYATGVAVSSTIVHATPASFLAHDVSRNNYEAIAVDIAHADVDFLVGGGQKYFYQRDDRKDLIREWQQRNYQVGSYYDMELENWQIDLRQPAVFFTANDSPLSAEQGRSYLPFATSLGANYLSRRSEQGFFLLVEGSQIDWGGHAKDANYIENELRDFDDAVRKAISFARRDQETLVIVTADHETGGLAVHQHEDTDKPFGKFTSNNHTGTMVPVYAYGPKAELFSGIYENTAIYDKIVEALGW